MSHRHRPVLTILLAAGLAACESLPWEPASPGEVRPGMTKTDVTAALGAPVRIRSDGPREAWQYCRSRLGVDHYLVVWFEGPRAVAADREPDTGFGLCAAQMEGFRWTDAPGG